MKHIFLNLKRFDVPVEYGGVNRLSSLKDWAKTIVSSTQDGLRKYVPQEVEFVQYFPEAHLLSAISVLQDDSPVKVGCQSIYRYDTAVGGNFGAFTTNRPASSMAALGVNNVIIGHCEERNDKFDILQKAGINNSEVVNQILNDEIKCAINRGMSVLYCIGEKQEELDNWQEVLKQQIEIGLKDVDKTKVVIGYEPVWSIGPGKTPADKEYITKIARYVKEITGGIDVVYGGGLKVDNAQMLASIQEIDGGLIALTRFSGEIGFYPDEYLQIIQTYLGK